MQDNLPVSDAPDHKESKGSSIQVIDRMMTLIDALASHGDPITLKQLAHDTSLHPSTAHRILSALIAQGFVERTENSSYRLGIRLLELGNLVKSRISVREVAMPAMLRLHAYTGESVNLGVRSGDEIVYVERTSSGRSAVRVVHIGQVHRAHLAFAQAGWLFNRCSAVGHGDVVKFAHLLGRPVAAAPAPSARDTVCGFAADITFRFTA